MAARSVLRIGLFAVGAAAACVWAPTALADDATAQAEMGSPVDVGGGQMWTVTDLRPSSDVIAFAPAGTLWEASVTAAPTAGGVPIIPGFSARSAAESYPVLWTVPSALGVNPAPVAAGGSSAGKLYFDVTGSAPTSVAYSSGGHDTAMWVPPAPPPAAAAPGYVSPAPATGGYAPAMVTPQAPAAAPSAPAPAATPAPAPAAGSTGTPATAPRSAGTPLAPQSAATPAATTPPTGGTSPMAGEAPAAPAAPATPAPADAAASAPSTSAPAAGSAGTPLSATPTTTVVPSPAVTPAG